MDLFGPDGPVVPKRQQVHLSANKDTAISVEARYGTPILIVVAARRMFDDGMLLYQAENGVWLTDSVPAAYLDFGQAESR